MTSNRRHSTGLWVFLGVAFVLTAVYARFQLVPTLAFVAQVFLLVAQGLGIPVPSLPS